METPDLLESLKEFAIDVDSAYKRSKEAHEIRMSEIKERHEARMKVLGLR